MILAQNRRQPSNGSRWLILLALFVAFSSCDLFRKADGTKVTSKKQDPELEEIQGKKVYDPETGTYVVVDEIPSETMDTIRWKDASGRPPIGSDGLLEGGGNLVRREGMGQFGSEFLSSYNVAVMLPFVTNRFQEDSDRIDPVSDWALHFYSGVRMALDELGDKGIKLNVSTLDTEGSTRKVSTMLRNNEDVKNANLIVGPYRRENVSLVASFAGNNNITFVSPHYVPTANSQPNPNYIQVNPSLQSHCQALVRHARKYYGTNQVVVVARNEPDEIQAIQYLQDENRALSGGFDTTRFQEYIVSADLGEESPRFDENIDVLPFVSLEDTTVFIVPSWGNERFVHAFLRKLEITRGPDNHIVVYGMPQWARYERVDFEYYDKLNVHVSSNFYLSPLSEEVQNFRRNFFDRYGVIPRDEAYIGRDIILYFGQMLQEHGTKFQYFMDGTPGDFMHTRFDFGQVVTPITTGRERLPIEKFENKYLHILKFEDFQFQPVY